MRHDKIFRPRLAVASAAVAVTCLLAGVPAHASTLFGSDLTATPVTGFDRASITMLAAPPGATVPIVAPAGGVLTRIRLRIAATRAAPGAIAFTILSGRGPFTARPATPDGAALRIPLPPSSPATFIDYRPTDQFGRATGIPIATGERLGLVNPQFAADPPFTMAAGVGSSTGYVFADHLSGAESYGGFSDFYLLLQGTIEPDADGDRRGDETQDQCPTLPNDPTTGTCPIPAPTTVTVPGPERVVAGPERVVQGPERVVQGPDRLVRECRVPSVIGLDRALAGRLLTAAGCRLGSVTAKTVRRGKNGIAVRQSPKAGSVVKVNAKVAITLSRRARR